jgi:alpha-methylacyl-CoA racemase
VTPVLSPWEAHLHPHNLARSSFLEVNGIVQPAPAPRFSRTSLGAPAPADANGRNVADTLQAWGLDPTETAMLLDNGSIA